jgi:hypothetical protein
MTSGRRHIEPPPSLDPVIARFIEELARAAVRRQNRRRKEPATVPEEESDP